MEWAVPIVVAVIGGPLMWGLHRFEKKNSEQHNHNHTMLTRIESKIEKLDDRIHGHIHWHASQEPTENIKPLRRKHEVH